MKPSQQRNEEIVVCTNPGVQDAPAPTGIFDIETTERVRAFHRTLPCYEPTPLVSLTRLSRSLGVRNIWVKDESHRFGLGAFKVLGASYGVASALATRAAIPTQGVTFDTLKSDEIRGRLGNVTVATATDGNHGRAVAWAARELGHKAVVYLPRGSSPVRLANIRALGADASEVEGTYDDAVAIAARHAEDNGWVLVQDTAWPGYDEVPRRIVQGYLTLIDEAYEQLSGQRPTHVLVQCGVGSLAMALLGFVVERFGNDRPHYTVVEPTEAAAFLGSMRAGRLTRFPGRLDTIMAGLAAGLPSNDAWEVLRCFADAFVACSDGIAVRGMRRLGRPLAGDPVVVSGESGAVTLGLIDRLLTHPVSRAAVDRLGLGPESRVLLVSTEGDTDPAFYKKVVWDTE